MRASLDSHLCLVASLAPRFVSVFWLLIILSEVVVRCPTQILRPFVAPNALRWFLPAFLVVLLPLSLVLPLRSLSGAQVLLSKGPAVIAGWLAVQFAKA